MPEKFSRTEVSNKIQAMPTTLMAFNLKIGGGLKVTEVLGLKSTEKGTRNKEALHDMVMKRLAKYVEKGD